jgi:hypothetical protein
VRPIHFIHVRRGGVPRAGLASWILDHDADADEKISRAFAADELRSAFRTLR